MFRKIGLRIRRVRLEQEIKQKDLARRIGISQGALTNFELGRRKISLEWLVKIARALETPVCYFLDDLEAKKEAGALAPREQRLLRAFRGMERDTRLQGDFLHAMERVGRHLSRRATRSR